ncbi:hypothetical protein LSAT2_011149 [Lamellibrachia satsuma]|nr:hypothetical protein LSAT2_011149 [Lamellibrachia satsuma]
MATHTMKAVVTQHVSIVKDWQDCLIAKCTKCCRWVRASEGQYHCPLCPVSVYPPSTRDRLLRHLQEHQRDGLTCGEWHILQCHMTCGGMTKPHFHCLYCSEVRVERKEVQRHISDCASSRQGSKQECTQVTSDAKVRLDTTKVTSSDSRIRGHLTVKHKVEREAPGEDQVNGSPTKTLPTVSPGESPTKRRRGRPPSVTKVAGRRVGRPPGKQQDAGEDSSLDMGKQLTDLLDRKMREDGQQDGEVEGTREEEEVFPVLAGVVPQTVLAVLPGSLAVSLRKVAQQSAVKWRKVNNGYMMHGHWSDMMTARTHIQQMLKNARSSQSKTSSRAPRRITKSSRQEENDTMQGESEMMDSSTVKVDRGATPPTDPGRTGEGVKEEAEGEYCGQDQDKSEDYEDITIDEATTEVKREPKGQSLQTRTRRGLHNRIIFKNPEQASRTCIECGYQSTVEGIKKHRARRHASVEHECAVCGMKFGIRYDMRRHRMTHFDVHGNMLPDAVTLLKSFQPDASPTSLSHWETSFVPEGSANDVAKSQDEIKDIQELLDFRNDDSAQSGDKDVLEKEQSISSDNIG